MPDYQYGKRRLQGVMDQQDMDIVGQMLDWALGQGWTGLRGSNPNLIRRPELADLYRFLPDTIQGDNFSYQKSYLGDILDELKAHGRPGPGPGGGGTGGGGGGVPGDPSSGLPSAPDMMPVAPSPGADTNILNDMLKMPIGEDDPRLGTVPTVPDTAGPAMPISMPEGVSTRPTPLVLEMPSGEGGGAGGGGGGAGVPGGGGSAQPLGPETGGGTAPVGTSAPSVFDFFEPFVPFLQDQADDEIWRSLAQAGFTGNRYSSAARRDAANVGGETALEMMARLSNFLFGTFENSQNRALQAALGAPALGLGFDAILNNQLGALQNFGLFEQGRADDIAQILFNSFNQNQFGLLPLILQLAAGQSPDLLGVPGASDPSSLSQFTDLASLLAQLLSLFDIF